MKEKHTEKKHEIAGPAGEETNTVAKIQAYIEDHRNLVIGVSVGIIVVVIGLFLLNDYMKKKEAENIEAASFALSQAQQLFLANDYKKALHGDPQKLVNNRPMLGLAEIAEKFDGTKSAKVAALYAAECYVNLGKYKESIPFFEEAAESESAVVKEGAFVGLGICSESEGKYDEAIENYEKAIAYAKTTASKDRYKYYQGLCYEKLGGKEKAEKIYLEIAAEDATEFVNLAKGGLARVGTIIE
jgi:tetratricopeptide (TPR) repeat protein